MTPLDPATVPGTYAHELEAVIEQYVVDYVLVRWRVRSIKLNLQGNNHWPDRQFFIPGGKPLFIEFKRLGEVATPPQQLIHKALRYHGYKVEVHDNRRTALCAVYAACTEALGAAPVSEEGGEVSARARRRRVVS
jgi:hypothetical protein